jgi:hypothetical protein
MTTQQITIDLLEAVFRALVRMAEVTDRPVELLVSESVMSNLPLSIDNTIQNYKRNSSECKH